MVTVDKSSIKNILVIKLRHIGDVLLTTPTLKALKKAMPDARITALVPAGTEEMLTLNPSVDDIIVFGKGRGIQAELGLISRVRSARFDLAINMTEGDRGALLAFVSGARYRVGMDPEGKGFIGKRFLFTHLVRPACDGRHRAVMDMDVLAPLGIEPAVAQAEIFTSKEDDGYVEALLAGMGVGKETPVAVAHPTSRWLFKCWRDEAVAEVMDYLDGRGIKVALTSGPDDRELAKARNILSLVKSRPLDFSGMLTLKRLAALMKRSVLFFGVDTAPMHMAAALGTPVVALFGPSDPKAWGPLTKKGRTVARASEFPCMPCHKDGCNGSKRSLCLEAITPDEAVKAIEELIGDRVPWPGVSG